MAQVIILHGWSDTSETFEPLADFLRDQGVEPVPMYLGDYISLDDDVRVEDVAKRLEVVLQERIDAGDLHPPMDMIVHSTGGLVARQWLSDYHSDGGSCIRRLIMLAPANHGSPLAKKGKSMLGRIAKGWSNWFETGKEMLDALELASSYQWSLVQKDLLSPAGEEGSPYGLSNDKVLPFVLTGTHPYGSGARRLVDEDGGDGTVRVASANMNTRGMTIDLTAADGSYNLNPWQSRSDIERIAFAVLADRNHGNITNPNDPGAAESAEDQRALGEHILKALATEADDYVSLASAWFDLSEQTARLAGDQVAREAYFGGKKSEDYFHQYFQIIMHVVDDHGNEVADYFIEYSDGSEGEERDATEYFHTEVLESVKENSNNKSLRCFFIDRTDLLNGYYPRIESPDLRRVFMTITAAAPGGNVRYFGEGQHRAAGQILAHQEQDQNRWPQRNQTHYVEIVIPRNPNDDVFRLRSQDEPFTEL